MGKRKTCFINIVIRKGKKLIVLFFYKKKFSTVKTESKPYAVNPSSLSLFSWLTVKFKHSLSRSSQDRNPLPQSKSNHNKRNMHKQFTRSLNYSRPLFLNYVNPFLLVFFSKRKSTTNLQH